MDFTTLLLCILFAASLVVLLCKPINLLPIIVYMWQRAQAMAKEGKFKKSKRQLKKDKTPATNFE